MQNVQTLTKRSALRFVLLLGVVSLFADFTYEGARSVTGPFLAILGASGTVVGVVAGLGELSGYGLRLVSGTWSERTQKFWPITLFGYFFQMSATAAYFLGISCRSGSGSRWIRRLSADRLPLRESPGSSEPWLQQSFMPARRRLTCGRQKQC